MAVVIQIVTTAMNRWAGEIVVLSPLMYTAERMSQFFLFFKWVHNILDATFTARAFVFFRCRFLDGLALTVFPEWKGLVMIHFFDFCHYISSLITQATILRLQRYGHIQHPRIFIDFEAHMILLCANFVRKMQKFPAWRPNRACRAK